MSQVPPPRLIEQKLKHGQKFWPEDDYDRLTVPHTVPAFVNAQRQRDIKVEELIPVRPMSVSFATGLYNVFNEEECLQMIEMANSKGFNSALINIGGGKQQFIPEARDNSRCIVDDEAIANYMMEIFRPYLPATFNRRKIHNLNERLRFLCYHQPGQNFAPHWDANFTRPGPHKFEGDTSYVTIQIYLNDGYEGGATTFLGERNKDETGPLAFHPAAGSVLIFSQDLYHEGSPVTAGIKYTIRTEAMYYPHDLGAEDDENHVTQWLDNQRGEQM